MDNLILIFIWIWFFYFYIIFIGHDKRENIFFVPMHGGIWTLCIDLEENEMNELRQYGFPRTSKCISYMDESIEYSRQEEMKNDVSNNEYLGRRPSMSMSGHGLSICLFDL